MHMKRVLIASDDDFTRAWIKAALEALDLVMVESSASGIGDAAITHEPALVVADGGRTPEAVVSAVEMLAGEGTATKLLLIIESEALPSLRMPVRLTGDFLVRGAPSPELAARARNLLWPGEEAAGDELIRVDALTLNLATYQALIGGEPVDFTYLEYALFSFLATHPGRTYSREALLRRVWGTDYYGGSRTVDVHVRRVRAKIGPELSRRLETVRNVGYLWNA